MALYGFQFEELLAFSVATGGGMHAVNSLMWPLQDHTDVQLCKKGLSYKYIKDG